MNDKFEHIRPYSDTEAIEAIHDLFDNQVFIKSLSFLKDLYNVQELVKIAKESKTILDFQMGFSSKVYSYFIQKSSTGIHYSGIENIDPSKAYLYIANHRDIILDSSSLQNYMFKNNMEGARSAIGDNLVTSPIFVELARINNMMLVLRSSSIHEKIANLHLLSEYIHHSIFEENQSVWIAQRSGRTKDGCDLTQQGLIKMFAMAQKEDPLETLKSLNITPVTISYEYESCDQLKARELALSENGEYVKKPGEDFKSIVQGVLGYKGEIRLHIGNPINEKLNTIDRSLNNNDQLYAVCKLVDQQIYQDYQLFKNNYIAFDFQENSKEFEHLYTEKEKTDFLSYLAKQAKVEDVSEEKMMHYLLLIYSNPVRTKFGKPITENFNIE
jgi:1-acyl-sn-glycerol-3-phosphate acyltransferase